MADKQTNRRYRIYASVVYPDSSPENWQQVLVDQFVPALISPLHDLDTNPDGELKKHHWHVMLLYDAPKSIDQAEDIFKKISGVGCEVVQSVRGYARYLCHLDNPEKHQYQIEDVRAICGADYTSVIELVTDKYKAIREIMEFVRKNDMYSYSDLLDYCSNEHFDWFRVLCDNGTVVIKEYLKSRAWTTYQRSKEVNKNVRSEAEQSSVRSQPNEDSDE